MSESDPTSPSAAHRRFAAEFFNEVWGLLDKDRRSEEETEEMISLAHASVAHWRRREDFTPRNLSIGYWQLSRVYAVAGQAENARRYGELCREASVAEAPFYRAYAHEALARAARLAGDHPVAIDHLAEASKLAGEITDDRDRGALEEDLKSLG